MAVRAWRIWGTSIVLAGGLVAVAQTPKSEVNGRATPAITQDYYQPESAPPPRILPQQVRESNPSKTAPPVVGRDFGCTMPGVLAVDLGTPIRVTCFGTTIKPFGVGEPAGDWKARAALDVAEMFFDSCDVSEARAWYQEVIKLAPGSKYAATAGERLEQMTGNPPVGESAEPPLAGIPATEFQARGRIR